MHRVRQFVAHLAARVTPEEAAARTGILPSDAVRLFEAMPVADRRHALDVTERLLSAGVDDRDVLAAALLHDAAKGHRMRLWHRVGGVLLQAIAPALLRRLADPDSRSWRYGFHLYLDHPRLSAELATAAGVSPRAAGFIRGQAQGEDVQLLRALTAADDAS